MNDGWIKLHRSIWKNPVSEKPKYICIFLYLVSHANYKDKDTIINNKKFTIRRGSFICSGRKIARHFHTSPTTAHRIFNYLETEQMIEHKSMGSMTLFTVLNYDRFQKTEQDAKDEWDMDGRWMKTTKKGKKDKKGKKENKNINICGPYGRVKLTSKELDKLENKIGKVDTELFIYRLDKYIEKNLKGKDKYKSHYLTILAWYRKDQKKQESSNKSKKNNNNLPGDIYNREPKKVKMVDGELIVG